MANENIGSETVYKENVIEKIKEPEHYKVILFNDDFTPQEFVVEILEAVFHKSRREATQIMLEVHHKGKGLVGIYSYDIARTKMYQVINMAREREFPLKCVVEKA